MDQSEKDKAENKTNLINQRPKSQEQAFRYNRRKIASQILLANFKDSEQSYNNINKQPPRQQSIQEEGLQVGP